MPVCNSLRESFASMPDYPGQRLRKDTPSQHETYVDMVPGEWIHVRIEVKGAKAKIYVGGATQPTMIVPDIKHGDSLGLLALWVDVGTIAHFANLQIY